MAVVTQSFNLTGQWTKISDQKNTYISIEKGHNYDMIFTDTDIVPADSDNGHNVTKEDLHFYNGQVETKSYYVWVRSEEGTSLTITLF